MPDERTHISKMLGISDEDATAVIKDIAAAVTTHPRMSDVVRELAAKYGKKAILAGMMLDKTFDANERVHDLTVNEHVHDFTANGEVVE